MAPGIVAATCDTLADDDPRIVVAEDTGILLVALGRARNLTLLVDVLGKCRIVQHHTVLALQILLT